MGGGEGGGGEGGGGGGGSGGEGEGGEGREKVSPLLHHFFFSPAVSSGWKTSRKSQITPQESDEESRRIPEMRHPYKAKNSQRFEILESLVALGLWNPQRGIFELIL